MVVLSLENPSEGRIPHEKWQRWMTVLMEEVDRTGPPAFGTSKRVAPESAPHSLEPRTSGRRPPPCKITVYRTQTHARVHTQCLMKPESTTCGNKGHDQKVVPSMCPDLRTVGFIKHPACQPERRRQVPRGFIFLQPHSLPLGEGEGQIHCTDEDTEVQRD